MAPQYLTLSCTPGGLTSALLSDLDLSSGQAQWLSPETAAIFDIAGRDAAPLQAALTDTKADWLFTDEQPRPMALFLADMDSTMIEIECIDELADYAGVKAEVSQVTEQAMRGELDFREALAARVRLLEGLPVTVLEECYRERVTFSYGAKAAVQTMAARGCRCVLVSGGFTFFTQRVAEELGFHHHRANQLGVTGDQLSGEVLPPISDANTKLETLHAEQSALGLTSDRIMAVGDGANDLPMIKAAGLGIAYRAKPVTRDAADTAIDHSDLTALLHFQGLSA